MESILNKIFQVVKIHSKYLPIKHQISYTTGETQGTSSKHWTEAPKKMDIRIMHQQR